MRAFAWTAVAALAGAVHHGLVTFSDTWADPSWALISGFVVVAISYILAASVVEVLGQGHARTFWLLRSVSLVAYAGVAVSGHAGIAAILLCEGITMLAVLALWGVAVHRRHPKAASVVVALLASMLAAVVRGMPPDRVLLPGFDPTALYHVAQIPGLILLSWAVSSPHALRLRACPRKIGA